MVTLAVGDALHSRVVAKRVKALFNFFICVLDNYIPYSRNVGSLAGRASYISEIIIVGSSL